jgi:hypothetical protein
MAFFRSFLASLYSSLVCSYSFLLYFLFVLVIFLLAFRQLLRNKSMFSVHQYTGFLFLLPVVFGVAASLALFIFWMNASGELTSSSHTIFPSCLRNFFTHSLFSDHHCFSRLTAIPFLVSVVCLPTAIS